MILSHGVEDVYENKDKIPRYKFFTEFAARHGDGIYGLDRSLMQSFREHCSSRPLWATAPSAASFCCTVLSASLRRSTIARLLNAAG